MQYQNIYDKFIWNIILFNKNAYLVKVQSCAKTYHLVIINIYEQLVNLINGVFILTRQVYIFINVNISFIRGNNPERIRHRTSVCTNAHARLQTHREFIPDICLPRTENKKK